MKQILGILITGAVLILVLAGIVGSYPQTGINVNVTTTISNETVTASVMSSGTGSFTNLKSTATYTAASIVATTITTTNLTTNGTATAVSVYTSGGIFSTLTISANGGLKTGGSVTAELVSATTGSFANVNLTGYVSAPTGSFTTGTITGTATANLFSGPTGSFTNVNYTDTVSGPTGSFTNVTFTGTVSGPTGSFNTGIKSAGTVTGNLVSSLTFSLNHAVCFKAAGVMGYCSDVVSATGTCTCN